MANAGPGAEHRLYHGSATVFLLPAAGTGSGRRVDAPLLRVDAVKRGRGEHAGQRGAVLRGESTDAGHRGYRSAAALCTRHWSGSGARSGAVTSMAEMSAAQPRASADPASPRRRPLRRLAGRAKSIAGYVGADNQRGAPAYRARGNPVAALGVRRCRRSRRAWSRRRSSCAAGILIRTGNHHLERAEATCVLGRRRATCRGQVGQIRIAAWNGKRDGMDAKRSLPGVKYFTGVEDDWAAVAIKTEATGAAGCVSG